MSIAVPHQKGNKEGQEKEVGPRETLTPLRSGWSRAAMKRGGGRDLQRRGGTAIKSIVNINKTKKVEV